MTRRYAPAVSIVTGGASGIGRALVTELALRGGRVVVADVDEAGARHISSVLTDLGYAVTPAVVDVTDRAAVGGLVREVAAREGRLDVMVNNAGIAVAGPVLSLEERHWRRAVDVNQWGVIHGSLALEVMRGQDAVPVGGRGRPRRGTILNTASLAGLIVAPRMLPYLVTKHAVVAFSRGLALEAAELGVAVHALCPDFVDTPLLDQTGHRRVRGTSGPWRAGCSRGCRRPRWWPGGRWTVSGPGARSSRSRRSLRSCGGPSARCRGSSTGRRGGWCGPERQGCRGGSCGPLRRPAWHLPTARREPCLVY